MELLKENNDWHEYYDRVSDYDEYTVLRMIHNGKNLWAPLIKPTMYQQALNEFTRTGRLEKFPTAYVYQWMGIIMKNTAIIRAITALAGHDMGFPTDAVVDAFFGQDYEAWEEYKNSLKHKGNFSPDFGWMGQEEDDFDEEEEVDDEEAATQYLEDNGYYSQMVLPDGSDAWSDYGIQPLESIIMEYDESLEPEKVLVLINRALDVTHQRGDLASAFIEGGWNTLTRISNGGYVNESIKAFHGSPCKDIVTGKFKRGKTGYLGPGIYFSEDKEYSRRYARKYGEGAIYEVEINLLNPLVLTGDNPTKDFLTAVYKTEKVYLNRERKQSNICYLIEAKDIRRFLSLGYDGVIWDFAGNKEYVLYDNSNITIINKEEVLRESIEDNMDRDVKEIGAELKPYIKSLFEYMSKHGHTTKQAPKIILDNTKQDGVFVSTGYFDPDAKAIRLFVNGRGYKDILRTLAHEFIHRKQDEDGVIEKSGYQGDKITEDKALVKLEAEAYLKGNLAFRSWTEEESKKGNLK